MDQILREKDILKKKYCGLYNNYALIILLLLYFKWLCFGFVSCSKSLDVLHQDIQQAAYFVKMGPSLRFVLPAATHKTINFVGSACIHFNICSQVNKLAYGVRDRARCAALDYWNV